MSSLLDQRKQELMARKAKLKELLELQRECFQMEIQIMARGSYNRDITQAVEMVSGFFGVQASELLGGRKTREIAECRMWLYLVLFDHYRMSYSEVGRALDKDHGTIIHGVKIIRERMSQDPRQRETWTLLSERLAIVQMTDANKTDVSKLATMEIPNRNGNGKTLLPNEGK